MTDRRLPVPSSTRRLGLGWVLGALCVVALLLSSAMTAPSWASDSNHGDGHRNPADAWAGTWSASPTMPEATGVSHAGFADQTVRMIVRTSVGGDALRVRLSNAYGAGPVTFDAVTVGLRDDVGDGAASLRGAPAALTFGGARSVTVRQGGDVYSDVVARSIPAQSDVVVSAYVERPTGPVSWHSTARATTWVADGDHSEDVDGGAFDTNHPHWFWLSGVDVRNKHVRRTVVAFGDSITDGGQATIDANARYPDALARRLLTAAPPGRRVSVLNSGIGGNRILHDAPEALPRQGEKGVTRFDRDVLAQTGVTDVIILEGINDIGFSDSDLAPDEEVSAAEIIEGLRNLIGRARAKNLRVYGGTLPPYRGSFYYSTEGEAKRQRVNEFIRSSGQFDAVIDFDAALRDPDDPLRLRPAYDSGDHLHPSDAGYRAMAEAVPVSQFTTTMCYAQCG